MKKLILSSFLAVFTFIMTANTADVEIRREKPSNKPLNRKVFLIAETLKKIESNKDYNAIGASDEFGAYQIQKETWKYWCKKHFDADTIMKMTPENQDKMAYIVIESLVDKGYSPKQIASIWNCNSPKWEGKIGINRYGVKYNVPLYVEKFSKVYNNLRL